MIANGIWIVKDWPRHIMPPRDSLGLSLRFASYRGYMGQRYTEKDLGLEGTRSNILPEVLSLAKNMAANISHQIYNGNATISVKDGYMTKLLDVSKLLELSVPHSKAATTFRSGKNGTKWWEECPMHVQRKWTLDQRITDKSDHVKWKTQEDIVRTFSGK